MVIYSFNAQLRLRTPNEANLRVKGLWLCWKQAVGGQWRPCQSAQNDVFIVKFSSHLLILIL